MHVVQWFKTYPSNRSQSTHVNGTLSDNLPSSRGVPQGSLLEPILFLIYINDLQVWEVSSSVLIYADHTSLTLYANDPTTIRKKINEDLMRFKRGWYLALIKAWLIDWLIDFDWHSCAFFLQTSVHWGLAKMEETVRLTIVTATFVNAPRESGAKTVPKVPINFLKKKKNKQTFHTSVIRLSLIQWMNSAQPYDLHHRTRNWNNI